MLQIHSNSFHYVVEPGDGFLELWPHRYDYIWAEHPHPGQRPAWKTESRHPLSDRLINQGSYLYGVRFGAQTNYCLLDIDAGSPYHPRQDSFAIPRIVAALEALGLVAHVACTSSYSGGIHLYFPFEAAQKSYQLAIALQSVLQSAGFQVELGQLEIFPNPKPYRREGDPALYAAHRLPMQMGSYLLELEGHCWDRKFGDQSAFVTQWKFARRKNDVSCETLEQIIKASKRVKYALSGKADKFLNDLNADIEVGWTGYGQTNFLLGRITLRSYVFGHLLDSCDPLVGKALVRRIVTIAQSLPGYREFCRHQGEIEKRAEEWAACVENSHYFPYGRGSKGTSQSRKLEDSNEEKPPSTWNQQCSLQARERIRLAIADLLEKNALPMGAKARFQVLTRHYHLGGQTLYRHKDLWHPACLWNSPQTPPIEQQNPRVGCAEGAPTLKDSRSLLEADDSNLLLDKGFGDVDGDWSLDQECNLPLSSIEQGVAQDVAEDGSINEMFPFKGPQDIRQLLIAIRERQKAERSHSQQLSVLSMAQLTVRKEPEQPQATHRQRMQRYLASNDPILVAEAMTWFRANSS